MDKLNRIEEMARVLCKNCAGHTSPCSVAKAGEMCGVVRREAEALYNAGYRKQSEGEWIDQYNGKCANPIYVCSVCMKGTLLKPHINELDNMEMIQALSPFCPKCGAKMKGGEEE